MFEPKAAYLRLSAEKRAEIESTIMDLYIEKPYDDVTAKLICEKLSINPATLYRWFDSKDDIFLYLHYMVNNKMTHALDTDWSMDDYIYGSLDLPKGLTEREHTFALGWYNAPESVLSKLIFDYNVYEDKSVRFNLERMKASGEVRQDLDVELASFIYNSMSYNILKYVRAKNITDSDEILKISHYIYYSLLRFGIKGFQKSGE